jgi:hypothetical protein
VAAAGDTDNDFYTDFLIGYPGYNLLAANGQVATPEAGRVWLVYGSRKQAP